MTALRFQWAPAPRRITGRWLVAARPYAVAAQPARLPVLAIVMGPPGAPGGTAAPVASLVTAVDLIEGEPLAVERATGRLTRADAAVYPLAMCVGLAAATVPAGFPVDATGLGAFSLPDWTAIVGVPALLSGQTYFLAPGGGLSTLRPTMPGGSVTIVGVAVSPTTLDIRRTTPILL